MAEIKREKEIIADDIEECRRRAERKVTLEENALRRRRRIYGFDPEELSVEAFKRKLGEALVKKYTNKLNGLKKNYKKAGRKFDSLFIDETLKTDFERLERYEYFILFVVLSRIKGKSDFEDCPIELSLMREYRSFTKEQREKLMEESKNKYSKKKLDDNILRRAMEKDEG